MTQDPLPPPEIEKSPALHGNEDGTRGNYSGEEYDSYEESKPRNVEVGASRDSREADVGASNGKRGEDIPTEAGKRAYIDEKTGEVHGSGAGAGGGNATEDYDTHTPGGG